MLGYISKNFSLRNHWHWLYRPQLTCSCQWLIVASNSFLIRKSTQRCGIKWTAKQRSNSSTKKFGILNNYDLPLNYLSDIELMQKKKPIQLKSSLNELNFDAILLRKHNQNTVKRDDWSRINHQTTTHWALGFLTKWAEHRIKATYDPSFSPINRNRAPKKCDKGKNIKSNIRNNWIA